MIAKIFVLSALLFVTPIQLVSAERIEGWTNPRLMTLEDHKAYFSEGDFLRARSGKRTRARVQFSNIRYESTAAGEIRVHDTTVLLVSPQEEIKSDWPFVKHVVDTKSETFTWSENTSSFTKTASELHKTPGYFHSISSWESDNERLEIAEGDEHIEYGANRKRPSGNWKRLSHKCWFIEHQFYEVMCSYRASLMGPRQRYFFTRMSAHIS